jgi:hypothetical protein
MKARLALAAAAAAMTVAGCGGGGGGGGAATGDESAASLVPANAPVFVTLNTNFSSKQIESADAVLQKFPIRDRVLREARSVLREYGIDIEKLRRTAGPEIDVAVLDTRRDTAVGFARPPDAERFARVLDAQRKRLVHTTSGDWTLFARDRASLRAVHDADEKLADLQAYRDATDTLPDENVATAYVSGNAVTRAVRDIGGVPQQVLGQNETHWVSAALLSHDDGIELQLHVKTPAARNLENVDPALADLVPSGSVAAVCLNDLAPALRRLATAGARFVPQVERVLRVPLTDVAEATGGQGVLYVRPSLAIPEVTLILEPDNTTKAMAVLDRVARAVAPAAAAPRATTVDGTEVRELALGAVTMYYGVVDGKVVVTDSSAAIRAINDHRVEKLADDKVFSEVKDAAAMPDTTNGWLYLNFKDGVPLVDALVTLAGSRIPPEIDANLRPLRSAIVYGTRHGDVETVVAFVQTS